MGAQALREHQAWPRIAVPVVAALKDLGVVVGSGMQGKLQHQQRLVELLRRDNLVGRLGLPFGKRERLVASSAIPAGLHGCAAQPPDSDTLDTARKHVLFALHRGSRFCQLPLFFTIAVNSWRADPGAVWVWKAVESARLIGRSLGRQAFAATWAARTQGPIGGLKVALSWAEMELRGTFLWSHEEGPCILEATRHKLRSFVLKAIRRRDLGKAARRKEQQGLQECADVDDCRRILKRLPAQGLQEATRAVATGDVVTRSQSRFWQGHDGSCHCGGGKETVKHFLWSCPFTWAARDSMGETLAACTASLPFRQSWASRRGMTSCASGGTTGKVSRTAQAPGRQIKSGLTPPVSIRAMEP